MRIGTSYFVSKKTAVTYYRVYHGPYTADRVDEKIASGEITIGKPDLEPGEKLSLIDGNTRYAIDDGKP